ncbi:MAG: hypothetical protein ACO1TE_28410 [Prosthecobacter sp.]
MKRNALILSAAALIFNLASCSSTAEAPRASVIGKSGSTYVVSAPPATKVPLYYNNNIAIHHYDPSLYTPFTYDHRGTSHNNYFRAQAIREAVREAKRNGGTSVEVGPIEAASE